VRKLASDPYFDDILQAEGYLVGYSVNLACKNYELRTRLEQTLRKEGANVSFATHSAFAVCEIGYLPLRFF